ncbi:hypothetical protein K6L59_02980, partial [Candidatus Phytoplasma sp. Tabriz.2]|nr:hypothetical protein [Candidatus Phytoplasma australiense]
PLNTRLFKLLIHERLIKLSLNVIRNSFLSPFLFIYIYIYIYILKYNTSRVTTPTLSMYMFL